MTEVNIFWDILQMKELKNSGFINSSSVPKRLSERFVKKIHQIFELLKTYLIMIERAEKQQAKAVYTIISFANCFSFSFSNFSAVIFKSAQSFSYWNKNFKSTFFFLLYDFYCEYQIRRGVFMLKQCFHPKDFTYCDVANYSAPEFHT